MEIGEPVREDGMEQYLSVREAADLVRHVARRAGADYLGQALHDRVQDVLDWDDAAAYFRIAHSWWREIIGGYARGGDALRLDYLLCAFAWPTGENICEAIRAHAKRAEWPLREGILARWQAVGGVSEGG